MPIELSQGDRQFLERFVTRKPRTTRRQRAQALLLLAAGHSPSFVSQIVGIPKAAVQSLEEQYAVRDLAAVQRSSAESTGTACEGSGIEKAAGVCGGSARISGTRIPVWQLVEARDLGVTEAQLLLVYPSLRARDLVNAWSYAESHRGEILAEIHENEVA
jgi:uncharacterized protein (DUF433 family)